MKYLKTTALLTIACTALCSYTVSAENLKIYQNNGIYVDSTTKSASLAAIGKVDSDTYVLTDDAGLSPKVNINQIREQQALLDPQTLPEPTIVVTTTTVKSINTPPVQ